MSNLYELYDDNAPWRARLIRKWTWNSDWIEIESRCSRLVYFVYLLTQPDRGVPKILYVTPCDTDTEITFFESRPPWSHWVTFCRSVVEIPPRKSFFVITFTFESNAIGCQVVSLSIPGFYFLRSIQDNLTKLIRRAQGHVVVRKLYYWKDLADISRNHELFKTLRNFLFSSR